jgi:XRE family aerobic/anaerobic benzoate catabolism transcriptional regulator
MTLKALAAASGVSTRYLVELENGRGNISISRLESIALALELPICGFFLAPDVGQVVAKLSELAPGDLETVRQVVERVRNSGSRPQLVALLGVRGAGKSTVGRQVAEALAMEFIELDAHIEVLAGLSLAEIFAIHGPDYYREVEHQALRELLKEERGAVVATGGSLVTHPESWSLLRERSLTVWLKAEARDHWDRVIAQGDLRPMERNPGAYAQLEALLMARSPLYEEAAVVVETSEKPLEVVIGEVIDCVRGEANGLVLHGHA